MHRNLIRFIRSRYVAVHGATAPVHYDRFMGRMRSTSRGAALGFRSAAEGPLFLEQYLDQPIELVLAAHFGPGVQRARIVEIGGLAATSGLALVELWMDAARGLGADADIGVAVLTGSLRSMFSRLGIHLRELAPARVERLRDEAGQWGNYYDNDPVVCAGSLYDGYRQLQRFVARRHREPVA